MTGTTIHRCYSCGKNEYERNMLEYNDHHFCGIRCKKAQERIEDERLSTVNTDRVQLRALGESLQRK